MGILMQGQRFTRQEAFDVLRVASQNSNRKLAEVASDVADAGTLTIPRYLPAAPGDLIGRSALPAGFRCVDCGRRARTAPLW